MRLMKARFTVFPLKKDHLKMNNGKWNIKKNLIIKFSFD